MAKSRSEAGKNKKTLKKPAKKTAKKTAKKASQRATKKSAEKAAKKTSKTATTKSPARKAAKESTKKTTKKASKGATKKATKKTAKRGAAKKASKKSAGKKTAKRPAKKAALKAAGQETSKKAARSASKKVNSKTIKKAGRGSKSAIVAQKGGAGRGGTKGRPANPPASGVIQHAGAQRSAETQALPNSESSPLAMAQDPVPTHITREQAAAQGPSGSSNPPAAIEARFEDANVARIRGHVSERTRHGQARRDSY